MMMIMNYGIMFYSLIIFITSALTYHNCFPVSSVVRGRGDARNICLPIPSSHTLSLYTIHFFPFLNDLDPRANSQPISKKNIMSHQEQNMRESTLSFHHQVTEHVTRVSCSVELLDEDKQVRRFVTTDRKHLRTSERRFGESL